MSDNNAKMRVTTWLILAIEALIVVIVVCNILVVTTTSGRVYEKIESVPRCQAAVLYASETPISAKGRNSALDSRISAVAQLYKNGKVEQVISTGGNNAEEKSVVKELLIAYGVPSEVIHFDHSTGEAYNLLKHLNSTHSIDSIVVVSHEYCSQRALFVASRLGMKAIAYTVKEPQPLFTETFQFLKEIGTRVKMVFGIIV